MISRAELQALWKDMKQRHQLARKMGDVDTCRNCEQAILLIDFIIRSMDASLESAV